MISKILSVFKFTAVLLIMTSFLSVSVLLKIINPKKKVSSRALTRARKFTRLLLRVMGFELVINGKENLPSNSLVIANHMSYLDVLALKTVYPSIFLTSIEIQESKFLGDLCKSAGCLFVERRSIWNLKNEVTEISKTLQHGYNVTIFPEGTTTDGSTILPFRSSLLEAAKVAKVPVTTAVISYNNVNGDTFGPSNKDIVCWYSEMKFFPHLFKLCSLKSLTISIDLLPPANLTQEKCRKALAKTSQNEIAGRLDLKTSSDEDLFTKFYGKRIVYPGKMAI